jgi:PAS domain S-box-containing protein
MVMCTIERKSLENELRASQEYLQAVLDSAGDALVVLDAATGEIIDANRRVCEMFGYTYEEALCAPIGDLSQGEPPCSQADALEWLRKARQVGPQTFEWLAKHKDGHLFWVEVGMRFAVIGGDDRCVVIVHDISERKIFEQRIQHLNDVLRAIRNVNQMIVREHELTRVLEAACEILAQTCGYTIAWVGVKEAASMRVIPVCAAGEGKRYLGEVRITWDETATGQGPTGRAMRLRLPQFCQDMTSDPLYTPWREKALAYGFASSAAIPILHHDNLFGVLSVYAPQINAFGEEEADLLAELASDLAYALSNLEE